MKLYTYKTKKEQGLYPYSTLSADLPARTALILFLAVEDVLLYAAVANLVVHIDDGAEGADLVELGRRERGLVAGEQFVNPVGALVGLHDAAMRQLDLLVQTLKLDALVLHGGVPSLAVACGLIIATYHAINVVDYIPTYPLHE